MPTYDYECEECFEIFELRVSMSEYAEYATGRKPPCPKCGSKNTVRAFTPVNVVTRNRGSGGKSAGGGCCCGGGRCV